MGRDPLYPFISPRPTTSGSLDSKARPRVCTATCVLGPPLPAPNVRPVRASVPRFRYQRSHSERSGSRFRCARPDFRAGEDGGGHAGVALLAGTCAYISGGSGWASNGSEAHGSSVAAAFLEGLGAYDFFEDLNIGLTKLTWLARWDNLQELESFSIMKECSIGQWPHQVVQPDDAGGDLKMKHIYHI